MQRYIFKSEKRNVKCEKITTAYCFSIYTTVSGKKSDKILHSFDTVVAARVTVSPYLTKTLPEACFAT